MAKKKKVDLVKEYRDTMEARERAETPEEQAAAEQILTTAKAALVGKIAGVLGGFLNAKDDWVETLAKGEVSLSQAIKDNIVRFDIGTSATGMEAADQLSLAAEIEESDPQFSRDLLRRIFEARHQALLKDPVKRESREGAEVASNALMLYTKNTRELVQYLGGKGINEGHALNALVTLAEQDPLGARNVTEQLPKDVQTSLLVGRLSIEDPRAIGLMSPEALADQIRAQFENDQKPSSGFTDRDNMTAVTLLSLVLQEKAELGGEQLEEALVLFKMLGADTVRAIMKFDYNALQKGRRGGDTESAQAAKAVVREFWSTHKDNIRYASANYRERRKTQDAARHAAPAQPAPSIDILAQDIDLDNL